MKRVRGWRGRSHLGTRYPLVVPVALSHSPFSRRALEAYIDQPCGYAKVSFVGSVSNNKKLDIALEQRQREYREQRYCITEL